MKVVNHSFQDWLGEGGACLNFDAMNLKQGHLNVEYQVLYPNTSLIYKNIHVA
jgi:hypothetical protein